MANITQMVLGQMRHSGRCMMRSYRIIVLLIIRLITLNS